MKKSVVITIAVLILVFLALFYIFVPPLNPFVREGATFIAFMLITIGIVIFVFKAKDTVSNFKGFNNIRVVSKDKRYRISLILIALPILYFIIMAVISLPIFSFNIYKNQLGEPVNKVYKDDVEILDINTIPVVDKDLAAKLADRKLGEKTSIGSQVVLGEPTIQKYKGKLVWAVPLEHSGFFKWLANMQGTPGYILISATDQRDVEFVEGHNIKYQFGAYFNQDLLRKARLSGSIVDGLMDYSFEIDEEGVPHYIITTYKNKIGLSLGEATGAVIINAETGETKKYNIDSVPEWVDRIQPEDLIINQINNRGEYINGIFNFSNKDKFRTSQGSAIIYNNDRCYLFTGLTSVGGDEAATSFIMVDMKTKESVIYKMAGATEYAAAKSAEGKVQHLGYKATFPIITNIDSVPTYFMALKDKEGLIKQYAFVSIDDYTTVGNGETKEAALANYEKIIRNNGTGSNANELKEIVSNIYRIGDETTNNTLMYKIVLTDKKDIIFTANFELSEYLALTKEGDQVKINYYETDDKIIKIIGFENNNIK